MWLRSCAHGINTHNTCDRFTCSWNSHTNVKNRFWDCSCHRNCLGEKAGRERSLLVPGGVPRGDVTAWKENGGSFSSFSGKRGPPPTVLSGRKKKKGCSKILSTSVVVRSVHRNFSETGPFLSAHHATIMATPASPSRRKTLAASTMCFLAGSQGASAFSAASSPARSRSSCNLPAASICGPSSATRARRRIHAAVTNAFSPITEAEHESDTPPLPMEESPVVACVAARGQQQQQHRHHSLIGESLPSRLPAAVEERNFDPNILVSLSVLLFAGNIAFEIWNGCSMNSLPFSQTFFLLFICNSVVELAARDFLAKR